MEKTQEKRGSILDLFLIFLLLLCILGALLRWDSLRKDARLPLTQYTLTIDTETLARESAECLTVGEQLYTASGEAFGEVTALEYLPAEVTLSSLGHYYRGAWDRTERCVLRVRVTIEANLRDGVLLYRGKTPLAVGAPLELYSERMRLAACVDSFAPISAEK